MNRERVFQVLQAPHVSEKAAIVGDDNNQYVFKVAVDATKSEIRKSVEQLFKVKCRGRADAQGQGQDQAQSLGLQHQADLEESLCP
jgi:large subunit ribosomal protein L23